MDDFLKDFTWLFYIFFNVIILIGVCTSDNSETSKKDFWICALIANIFFSAIAVSFAVV